MGNVIPIFDKVRTEANTYSHFDDTDRLRSVVNASIHNFYAAEWKVIQAILAHAMVVPGVCWARIETLLRKAEVSKATFHRALNKAEELGLIQRVRRQKYNGQRGSNFIVFSEPTNLADETEHDTYEKSLESTPDKDSRPVSASVAFNSFNHKTYDYTVTMRARDEKLEKYILTGVEENGLIPMTIIRQIQTTLKERYSGYNFEASVNDIILAIWKANTIFTNLIKKSYHISSYGDYWATIFEQQLMDRKAKRNSEDTPYAADQRAVFFKYVLGGGRVAM